MRLLRVAFGILSHRDSAASVTSVKVILRLIARSSSIPNTRSTEDGPIFPFGSLRVTALADAFVSRTGAVFDFIANSPSYAVRIYEQSKKVCEVAQSVCTSR